MSAQIKIVHISDLHFSPGMHIDDAHSYSIELLQGIETKLAELGEPDLLVVSGDITDDGRNQSFLNAYQWLFGRPEIGHGEVSGLAMRPANAIVIPGNHDAYNAGQGPILWYQQVSLKHYNTLFQDKCPETGGWCMYRWMDLEPSGVYIAYLDSSLLGDSGVPHPDFIAKGRLCSYQADQLMTWYDSGMQGRLNVSLDSDLPIRKEAFAASLKILVMHHYLFKAVGDRSDYFMSIKDRDQALTNIALCDFDILLCGHRHIPEFGVHDYGSFLDKRARSRYLLNCARRRLGLYSLPVQLMDRDGKRTSKPFTHMVHLLARHLLSSRGGNLGTDISTTEIVETIEGWLRVGVNNKSFLRERLQDSVGSVAAFARCEIDYGEMREIERHIASAFGAPDRKSLTETAAQEVRRLAAIIGRRPFAQIMSGSSSKAITSDDERETRAFNFYIIESHGNNWLLSCTQYAWNQSQRAFSEGISHRHEFQKGWSR